MILNSSTFVPTHIPNIPRASDVQTLETLKPLSFSFQNVLELTVYDEDFATPDDHLLCALFDTAKLPIDRTVLLYFKPSSTVRLWDQCLHDRAEWSVEGTLT